MPNIFSRWSDVRAAAWSLGATLGLYFVGAAPLCAADWAQFRGPTGASAAVDAKLPTTWSESDKQNVAWKAELPGRGPSSPIVVGDRVVVTCSDGPLQEKMLVVCLDAKSGKQLWRRQFWATGRTYSHPDSANAAPTPASDGQRIFAFYSSNDLVCLDLDGNLQWLRGLAFDYPKAGNDVGMAASPLVVDGTVVVQVENLGDSFAAGIDAATGETRWRLPRKASMNWTSPTLFVSPQGRKLVLLQSPGILSAHDPATGEQAWQFEAECQTIPTAVGVDARVYLPAKGVTALDLSEGTAPKVLWESAQLNPNPASPIVVGKRIFALNRAGVLACADADTGKQLWQLRVGGTFWSTPVFADGRLYCFNQDGDAKVVEAGEKKGTIVGEAKFGERIQGSPAVAGDALYVRSDKHLWKIAAP
ncbi:MAG: PQQ-binding-like beta-propeller repeat protein [Pirellulales bacterium]